MYLHEHSGWTHFTWDAECLLPLLSEVRFSEGQLIGALSSLGFDFEQRTEARALTSTVVASSRIEGVELDEGQVYSSVSRQLGLDASAAQLDTRDVDGAVSIIVDAVKRRQDPLTQKRLLGWHAALFPTGYSGLRKIAVARLRTGDMSVVSGPVGREKVHYQAPAAAQVPALMREFLIWFNSAEETDLLLKVGIAHLWFLTIHPFDDGNGRIARALTELLLARADGESLRCYSMASFIQKHRGEYYRQLERAQKGLSDITVWLTWFLEAINRAVEESAQDVAVARQRAAFWEVVSGVSLNDRQRKVLTMLNGQFEGKLTAAKWAKICKVSPDTALRDINDLIAKRVLKKSPEGGRSTSYQLAGGDSKPQGRPQGGPQGRSFWA